MGDLAQKIQHLLIDEQLNRLDIERGCNLAAQEQLYGVVVQPHYVAVAKRILKETRVKVIALIGSPRGGTTTATKMYETQDVIQRGADEIALVLNFAALRDHEDLIAQNDVASVVQTARGRPVIVVLENFLTVEEKARACKIAERAKAAFVQTSLGGTDAELTLANVKILRVAASVPIIGAGRIETRERADTLIAAGAARVATSATERILG
jgi:deoxyribose-phosphate aldolase